MFLLNTPLLGKLAIFGSFLFLFSFSSVSQNIWTLEDCVDYALDNNLDIQKQIKLVESNKATLLQS